tara:strand:+ start:1727 stop:2302 length:576 start_codon:yes stop_codon:yes gene_type:complete
MSEQNTKSNTIELSRDVDAILIPNGIPVFLPKGDKVVITQELGGNYTVYINGNLARIDAKDRDALGFEKYNSSSVDIAKTKEIIGDGSIDEEEIWNTLSTCYDPEIPVDIVSLGLIYNVTIELLKTGGSKVLIDMTLTAPGCGMGPVLVEDVRTKLLKLVNVFEVEVQLVWDPQWSQDMMTDEAKLQLGML